MLICVLGYAKSGKTLLIESLVREAASRALRTIVLKCGRMHPGPGHGSSTAPRTQPDTRRAARAGAEHSLLWTPEGMLCDEEHCPTVPGLPPRQAAVDVWESRWPEALRMVLGRPWHETADLLVIEGRPVAGATKVLVAGTGPPKYPPDECHHVVDGPLNPGASGTAERLTGLARQLITMEEMRHEQSG